MSIQSIHMWRLIIWCGHALNSHEQLTSIWGFLGQRHQVGSVEIVPWYPMRPCRLCHSHFLTVVSYAFLPILQGCWLFKARSLPKVACSQTKDLAVTAGKPHSQLSQWSPDQSPLLRVRTCIMASTTAEIFLKDSNPMEPHRPQWTFQDLCAADRGQKPPRLPGESQPTQDGRGEWPSIHFIIFSTTYFILFRTWWIYNSLMEVKCPVQWVLQKKKLPMLWKWVQRATLWKAAEDFLQQKLLRPLMGWMCQCDPHRKNGDGYKFLPPMIWCWTFSVFEDQ